MTLHSLWLQEVPPGFRDVFVGFLRSKGLCGGNFQKYVEGKCDFYILLIVMTQITNKMHKACLFGLINLTFKTTYGQFFYLTYSM